MSSYRQTGTVLADRTFSVPLDHDRPEGERIEIFAREMAAADRASAGLPWLLFLQGGPGFGAPRPHGRDGWLGRALDDYRLLLLDQRGTGRSTPATRQTLGRFGTAAEQAGYLAHFRADAIVRDAELVRQAVTGGEPWSVLGQSYGGFCAVTYLSLAAGGHPRGRHHRRPARPGRPRRRCLPGHLRQGQGQDPGALRALPR
jgi:pimeloyl-ACP methyl ester carboxylesterase